MARLMEIHHQQKCFGLLSNYVLAISSSQKSYTEP
jgi:hypothetical protein